MLSLLVSSPVQPVTAREHLVIEIQTVEGRVALPVRQGGEKGQSSKRKNAKSARSRQFSRFMPEWNFQNHDELKLDSVSVSRGSSAGDMNDLELFSRAETVFIGESKDWRFLSYLHSRIDTHLLFDTILARWNHFGTVIVDFEVERSGILINKDIRVQAEDRILKVHVMRALRKALARRLPESVHLKSASSLRVRAKFEFLQGSSELNTKKQNTFTMPVLVFRRGTMDAPMPNNVGDFVATQLGIQAPKIVGDKLQFTILADPIEIIDRIKEYKRKKAQVEVGFDPFAEYLRDPDSNLN